MTLVPAPPRWRLARANRRRLRHCQTQNLHRWPRSMLTTPPIGGRATVRIPTPSRSNPHSAVARPPHHCGVSTRGFLPWRLSDAGPRARGTFREGPASETLHTNGSCCTGRPTVVYFPASGREIANMGIIILTGASGSGKTTIAEKIAEQCPEACVFRFDSIGVPSPEKRIAGWGSGGGLAACHDH
jgi:hypothetical protein